jgi:hypothetical protein
MNKEITQALACCDQAWEKVKSLKARICQIADAERFDAKKDHDIIIGVFNLVAGDLAFMEGLRADGLILRRVIE